MIFANTKLSDGWSEIFTFNPWEHDDIERLPTKVEEKTSTVTVLEVEQTESEEDQEELVNEEDDMEFDEDIEDDLDFIQSFLGIDL